ncbi:tagatose-bisphosphate aldolase [Allofustis seminis]|uniref:tagatose-bisphosphate aldolase n=1 Tax=Allofustis seminis TaxID=166939 RepID=UPI00036C8930|nr:tagatose-bisphosphate aldolase [Allofustis seminis]
MLKMTQQKKAAMDHLSASDGFIKALAIDQRGAMVRMFDALGAEATQEKIEHLKKLVSEELTPYASSILLDTIYGLPGAKARAENAGLLLAYEQTGYDKNVPGRLPRLISNLSVKRLVKESADGIKLLLYYDVDEDEVINDQKKAFVERVGSECAAEDAPFYLEILTYDAQMDNTNDAAFAKVKPHKVNQAIREFSKDCYGVDVLKVETPVNMNFVEGFAKDEVVYSQTEAAAAFKAQSEATHLPFIFLSAGVSAELFNKTLIFAKESGSTFNGVLCGRATWKGVVKVFIEEGEEAARHWLRTIGKENIQSLNQVVEENATSWYDLVEIQ